MTTAPFPAAVIAGVRVAARDHLRVTGTAEDMVIDRLAESALALAEAYTGSAIVARPHEAMMAAASAWRPLPVAPVTAITAVAPVTAIDIDATGTGWVRMAAAGPVRFVAGLAASWEAVPAPVAQGIVLLVAHLFDARTASAAPPAAVGALWRPWRRMRLVGDAR
ncbi:hypothetical protein ASE67_14280 [Sphingomonas sp. Leaf23]|uniref:hypothetical protein n=1 Tax=Sphingomonas sp. Leaf23 TaxID=1735689 RepID=UPI0006FA2200|nr:hypothetical protein [Sphingomonas sp. Leaf23]KQM85557.1 hypothetical protein ASE67_14280 [Sphingomonas sp. Leaf23]